MNAGAAEQERRGAGGQDVVGRQCDALEPGVHALIVPNADMNLAAFQQGHLVHAECFRQLQAYVGKPFGISRQESGQNALDGLGRCGQLEHAGISTLEQLYAFAKRAHLTQHSATIAEQLLASGSQEKPAADTVKKFETAFVFEIADLTRQGRLADTQTQCRLRNRAQVGYRDEGPQAFEVHPAYLQIA